MTKRIQADFDNYRKRAQRDKEDFTKAANDRLVLDLLTTLDDLDRAQAPSLGEEELRRTKDHIKGGLVLSLESSGARMNHLARQEIYFGRQMGHEEVLEQIESVSAAQMQDLARRLFAGKRCALAAVGRLSRMRTRREELEF